MAQVLNIFYLPHGADVNAVKELWRQKDLSELANKKTQLSYIDAPYKVIRLRYQTLSEVLRDITEERNLIIMHASHLKISPEELQLRLDGLKGKEFFTLRLLEPSLKILPFKPDTLPALTIMSLAHPADKPLFNLSGFGFVKTSDHIIDKMRDDVINGKTIKEICFEYDVSRQTAEKYTRELREKYCPTPKLSNLPVKLKSDFALDYLGKMPLSDSIRTVLKEFIASFNSKNTKRSYVYDLKVFLHWHGKGTSLEHLSEISTTTAQEYFQFLNATYKSDASINRRLHTMRLLFKYGIKHSYLSQNPFDVIAPKKHPHYKIKTETIHDDEIKDIIALFKKDIDENKSPTAKKYATRNYIAIIILCATGIRLKGLLSLRVCDFLTLNNGTYLNVISKGKERYTVKLDTKCTHLITEYLKTQFNQNDRDAYLIYSDYAKKDKPISDYGFYSMLKRKLKRHGFRNNISTHSFRVMFASQCHKHGMAIKEIQTRLNHKDINQTSAYIKVEQTDFNISWLPDIDQEAS